MQKNTDNNSERICNRCNILKPINEYYLNDLKRRIYACKTCQKTRNAKRQHRNITTKLFTAARKRARKLNLPFSITKDDIYVPKYCPLLGIKLRSNYTGAANNTSSANSPSLDKIYPEKGYVPGNVIVISHKANTIKSSATPQQLLSVARGVYDIITNHYPLTSKDMKTLWPQPYENPMLEGGGRE